MRNFKDWVLLYLKGLAMGGADVVPGVSGGTIAFITGIYEELIHSIRSFDAAAIRLLLSFKFRQFWKAVNGSFMMVLLLGIATSIISPGQADYFSFAGIFPYRSGPSFLG